MTEKGGVNGVAVRGARQIRNGCICSFCGWKREERIVRVRTTEVCLEVGVEVYGMRWWYIPKIRSFAHADPFLPMLRAATQWDC